MQCQEVPPTTSSGHRISDVVTAEPLTAQIPGSELRVQVRLDRISCWPHRRNSSDDARITGLQASNPSSNLFRGVPDLVRVAIVKHIELADDGFNVEDPQVSIIQ